MFSTRDRLAARAFAAALAVVAITAVVLTYAYAVASATGQQSDTAAMETVYAGRDAQRAVLSLLGQVSIGLVLVVMLVCVGLALARGHARWAVGALVVIIGANVTTQVLKRLLLDRPDFGLGVLNSLPSGHTTVVASATAATLLVAPPALRTVFVLGGSVATTLTGASTIVAGWHRPSDIVAALAVCLAWAALASLVLSRRVVRVRGTVLAALAGSGVGVIALGLLGVRPLDGWEGAPDAALVLGAVALVGSVFTAACATLAFHDDVSRETIDAVEPAATQP